MSVKSKKNPRKFSLKINHIVAECQKLQVHDSSLLTKSLESNVNQFNSALDEISFSDLNPMKFQASQAYHNSKQRINEYIADKNKIKDSLNKEKLQELLHKETIRSQSKRLSFGTLAQEDLNYLFTQNKRKFGEAYNSKCFSAITSPIRSCLPSIYNSPKDSESNIKKDRKLNEIISNMYKDKLGIVKIKQPFIKKESFGKRKRRISKLINGFSACEAIYMGSECLKDSQNLANKLKVEKMVVKQHEKEKKHNGNNVNRFK